MTSTTQVVGLNPLQRAPMAVPQQFSIGNDGHTIEELMQNDMQQKHEQPFTQQTFSTSPNGNNNNNDNNSNNNNVTFSDDQYDSDVDEYVKPNQSQGTLEQEGQVLRSGYLMKKGERLKIWKKKWFVLRASKLAYYKDHREYELLRIIDIADIHRAAEVVVKNKQGVFVILTPKRTFSVQTDSQKDLDEWIDAINNARLQHDMQSSSDIDSAANSTVRLDAQLASPITPVAPSLQRQNGLFRQGSLEIVPKRNQQNPLSLSDPGLLTIKELSLEDSSVGGNEMTTTNSNGNIPSPISPVAPVSQLSRGIQKQRQSTIADAAKILSSPTSPPKLANLSISTPNAYTQSLSLTSNETHPEFPPNSFSSNHSHVTVPGTPSSPGYCSGAERFGLEPNASSEEEEVVDDPVVLEAGRVATAANAPGSGLVTREELGSKVVRQGYLLKLGNAYKRWKKRWFVLRGDKLTYYKNAKEYQPHGIIPMATIIDCFQVDPVSKSKQYCLRIVTPKRNFVCCAPDEDTLLLWLDAIHVAIKHAEDTEDHDLLNQSVERFDNATSPVSPTAGQVLGRVADTDAGQGVSSIGTGNGTEILTAYSSSSSARPIPSQNFVAPKLSVAFSPPPANTVTFNLGTGTSM